LHTKTPFLFLATILGAAGALSLGCSSPADSPAAAACFDYSTFTGTTPATSFATDVLPLFRRSCGLSSSCHGDPSSTLPGQPFLGPAKSDPNPTAADISAILAGIVGKAAAKDPSMPVVTAGDPSKSFLMYKLDGVLTCSPLKCASDSSCGLTMPSGSPSLPASELDVIRRWIKQGAKNN
jgi:hypothetical protein